MLVSDYVWVLEAYLILPVFEIVITSVEIDLLYSLTFLYYTHICYFHSDQKIGLSFYAVYASLHKNK